MIVTLKDGSKKEYAEAKSVIDIAYDISEGLARAACAGEVNGEVVDLRTVIDSDCELNILTAKDEKGLAVLRHTASHVLAQAVQTLFPDAKVAIGPSIDTGFYYDFDCPPFSRDDLDAIEKEMKKIIKKGAKIERFTKSREDAIAYFQEKNEPYKVELIEDLPEGSEISFYSQGDWTDLCAGPHLMSVKGVKAFKLLSSSSAYWRGSEKNAMLTRIYGTAYASKDELKEHLEQMEEANKYCEIEAYQPQFSMVDRDNEELIRWAHAQDMGVMTYGTLGGGILTGKYRELKTYEANDNRNRFYPYFREPLFSKAMKLLSVMDEISKERNVPLAQIALNWTLKKEFISSCITGSQSRDKIEANCKVFDWELSAEEMQMLDKAIEEYSRE